MVLCPDKVRVGGMTTCCYPEAQHILSQHCMTAESACLACVGSCSRGQNYDFGATQPESALHDG